MTLKSGSGVFIESAGAATAQGGDKARGTEVLGMGSLVELAQRLRQVLVPVKPQAAFVGRLREELLEASRVRQASGRRWRRGLVIAAAVVGSVASVAGVITLVVLRRRSSAQARPA